MTLGVPRGAPIEDSVISVCTELKEVFTISVEGTSVERGPGLGVVWEGVPILVGGEDVMLNMGGGARGNGGVGIKVSH